MIHLPEGRRVKSIPLTHGLSTSALRHAFGLAGSCSHSRAMSPGISNSPRFISPWKATPRFSINWTASVRSSVPAVRSALIRDASFPSKRAASPLSLPAKLISDTRTAAPSTTHGSSDHASKMAPCSRMRWKHGPVRATAD